MTPWDKLKEECGIFGIVSHPEAARLAGTGRGRRREYSERLIAGSLDHNERR
jgi:hypothetical protein